MLLKFFVTNKSDYSTRSEYVYVVNGDFYLGYLAEFLDVPDRLVQFSAAYSKPDEMINDLNFPVIYYDEQAEEMFYV